MMYNLRVLIKEGKTEPRKRPRLKHFKQLGHKDKQLK